MTNRRPQDPRTKKVRDVESDIPTMGPDVGDPNATVMPDQRHIETFDPSATVMPLEIEAPKPRATRGGAAATRSLGGGERTMTADSLEPVRAAVREKAAAVEAAGAGAGAEGKRKKGASWLVWVMAFLVLGGIGFGVAWFLMNPPGGTAEPEKVAAEDAAAAGDAEAAAADAAGETGADAAVAASADAAGEVAADVAAAAADVAPEATAEVAVAAVDAAADAGAADVAAVASAEVIADSAAAVADTQVAAVGATDVAAVAPATPDVAVVEVVAPKVRNPIEATRLNEDGLAKRKVGDHAAAMKLYEQALAADPEHVWARYNYACELALAGRSKDALNELTTLYKLDTADSKRALGAARKDSDFRSIKESGQFFRLTNF